MWKRYERKGAARMLGCESGIKVEVEGIRSGEVGEGNNNEGGARARRCSRCSPVDSTVTRTSFKRRRPGLIYPPAPDEISLSPMESAILTSLYLCLQGPLLLLLRLTIIIIAIGQAEDGL
jgi:hypothetical protein